MRFSFPGSILAVLAFVVVTACENSNSAAAKLVAEVQKSVENSKNLEGEERLSALREAKAKLQRVIEKYPSSALATQLVSGQSVGQISMASVTTLIRTIGSDLGRKKAESVRAAWLAEAKLNDDQCSRTPTRHCLYIRARLIALASPVTMDIALAGICDDQRRLGMFAEAVETATAMSHPALRNGQLIRTAGAQAAKGQTEEATALVNRALGMVDFAENPLDRVISLATAAVVFSKLEDKRRSAEIFRLALQTFDTVHEPGTLADSVLGIVAEREVEAGFDDQVQTLLSRLSDKDLPFALGPVAEAHARNGNVVAAQITLQQIKGDSPVVGIFITAAERVATELAKRDQVRDAVSIRDMLKDYSEVVDVDEVTSSIAQAAADKDHIDLAMELSRSIAGKVNLASALAAIGLAQARAGNRELAAFTLSDAADHVKGRLAAIDVLIDVAIAEAKAGLIIEASAHLEAALATVDASPYPIWDQSIGHLAAGFVAVERYAQAFKLWDRISDENYRLRGLEMMAEQLKN